MTTGTPSGVGWFQKPQASLKNGDEVEVEVEVEVTRLGILKNKIKYVR